MSDIADNINLLKQSLPESVRLVAVSKTKPAGAVLEAYLTGHRCFGENRVQELLAKKDLLPADIEWHLIGHLQRNKVKLVVPFISLIHSVDSFRLVTAINEESRAIGKVTDILLQVHIAREETKYGFSPDEIHEMIVSPEYAAMKNMRICGLMGMATFTDDMDRVREEFRSLATLFASLKASVFSGSDSFRELSMGMSGDFRIAICEGSTMIRVGSLIFGERYRT
jgi:pyridoxal phosphate enzyme (YggS family)